jgi:hypothetical protein
LFPFYVPFFTTQLYILFSIFLRTWIPLRSWKSKLSLGPRDSSIPTHLSPIMLEIPVHMIPVFRWSTFFGWEDFFPMMSWRKIYYLVKSWNVFTKENMALPNMMCCPWYYQLLKESGMVKKKYGCVPAIWWTICHSL